MERHFSIGMFDNLSQAQHAVTDAVSHGVEKRDITVVVSDDLPDGSKGVLCDVNVIHPSDDTQRGYIGGGIGAAVGAFAGSVFMYLIGTSATLTTVWYAPQLFGALVGAATGASVGAFWGWFWPDFMALFAHQALPDVRCIGVGSDNKRSMLAAALGGVVGALAGVLASYLVGIPDMHYFIGMGFYAGAAALVIGSLVGGMSGRGLSPSSVGTYEELADAGQSVLVSINCEDSRRTEIEELLRLDGAKMVRVA